MIRKMSVLSVVMAILFLPVVAFSQNVGGRVNTIEDLNTGDIPNDSIVVLSEENTDIPGFVHEKYAFVDQDCPGGFQIVDHYGPPVDPRDPNLHQSEHAECNELRYRDKDDRGN
jgi:hypothetical protein